MFIFSLSLFKRVVAGAVIVLFACNSHASAMACSEIFSNQSGKEIHSILTSIVDPTNVNQADLNKLYVALAKFIPSGGNNRVAYIGKTFVPSLVPYLDFNASNLKFSFFLINELKNRGILLAKDEEGNFRLENNFYVRPVPQKVRAVDEVTLKKITDILNIDNPEHSKVMELRKLITELLPLDPEERYAIMYSVYGEALSNSVQTEYWTNEQANFAHFLLEGIMNKYGTFSGKTSDGKYQLVELLELGYPTLQ